VSARAWLYQLGVDLAALVRQAVVRPVPLTQYPWMTYDSLVNLWGYSNVDDIDRQIDRGLSFEPHLMRLRVAEHHVAL